MLFGNSKGKFPVYDSQIKYKINDGCLYEGEIYIALIDSPSSPATNAEHWTQFNGESGIQGPQGPQGPQGSQVGVVDTLTSTSTTDALSANQGYMLVSNLSNPNILINTNGKNPINQRNVSGALSANAYGFDRWYASSAYTPSATGEGLRFTFTTANTGASWGALQKVENPSYYVGKTLTASVKARASGADSAKILLSNTTDILAQQTFAADGEWHTVSVTFIHTLGGGTLYPGLGLVNNTADAYVEFEWIKLEEGTVATPWLIPDPQIELARCMRYYQFIGDFITTMQADASMSNIAYNTPLSMQMRTNPTATKIGTWTVSGCNQPIVYSAGNKNVSFYVTPSSAYIRAYIQASGTTQGITLDAEL